MNILALTSLMSVSPLSWINRLYNRGKYVIRFEGKYDSYQEAQSFCTGYSSDLILQRVLSSTLSVMSGEGVAERDGVIVVAPSYSPAILSGLLVACSRISGPLSILDFGGSLGSSFFQHSSILSYVNQLSWHIVEQPHYVASARRVISRNNLFFYETIEECLAASPINVCLLSGVLQCLPDPFGILKQVLAIQPDVLILDRTPYLNTGTNGYYSVQRVPPSIYPASYPSRFFVKDELFRPISSAGYSLISESPSIDNLVPYAKWLGHVYVRNIVSVNTLASG